MALVSTKEILKDAYENHYAIGAFGAHNLEIMKGIISGAEMMDTPVILQTTPGTINYVGIRFLRAIAEEMAAVSKVPVALHLDHGNSFDIVMKCLRSGYTSVMIDGSHLSFNDNVALVKRVVDAANPIGVPVEAELGTIGGVEDDLTVDESLATYTDPVAAEMFISETKVDSFAPAFGTAHGMYKREPKLRLDILEEIYNRTNCPLVMHGASGIPDSSLQNALKFGIAKVNFSTELKVVFAKELRNYLFDNPGQDDPRKYFLPAQEAVKNLVMNKIGLLQKKVYAK
ncbi:fructose-bisphosphate aldolase class II/tagatose 1,6-diphosphate aldolase GatY/KbaY [Evansella vedderi]|uniref:Fructose-bisphosphate aldolase class II/tagatose 1,6-diphosphate aldolase GatY/KbaY n=1 Tax=Evansella vedderi TaxID=38282 RepID=A0ABT9ZNB6_9BACI|nr:class II fructose-bisphosphate aldolase [Evansella vedderi]MDQ0252726.1 fructose-bisphosphate aldolase class II/tagatose 1,6-diphosphate aldolase GatY/KbaY [Evansella vedderi]